MNFEIILSVDKGLYTVDVVTGQRSVLRSMYGDRGRFIQSIGSDAVRSMYGVLNETVKYFKAIQYAKIDKYGLNLFTIVNGANLTDGEISAIVKYITKYEIFECIE